MQLREYLAINALTQKDFSSRLGVHTLTISRWMKGRFFPDKENQKKIAEITLGQVQPVDWFRLQYPAVD